MKTLIITVFVVIWISACATTPGNEGNNYSVDHFVGRWVMVNGPYKGRKYKAITEEKRLVVSPLSDTDCLQANEKAFFGEIVGNQIRGKAYVCIGGGNQSVSDIVISIHDMDTLIARIKSVAQIEFPDIRFERDALSK